MAWNPAKYMRFSGARMRPAMDLLQQAHMVAPQSVKTVVDLGCGPGNLTEALATSFPGAHIVCVDNSPEMLKAAEAAASKAGVTDVSFREASLETFEPETAADVVYSNAAIHWVQHHEKLLPHIFSGMTPGGVFAAQLPDTRVQPSHLLMETAAANLGWEDRVAAARIPRCENDPSFYMTVLAPLAGGPHAVNLWATEYAQVLEGENAVAAYTRQTGMKPMLAALGGEGSEDANAYEEEYRRLTAQAYPSDENGVTVFPFKRFFMVATKAAE